MVQPYGLETLRAAYPDYYLDTGAFIGRVAQRQLGVPHPLWFSRVRILTFACFYPDFNEF
jgi:hypothetical protein